MIVEKFIFCPKCATKLQEQNIDDEITQVCPACGFINWINPKPVVSILLARRGKVLMLQRANEPLRNYWVLPGGFIRIDETPQEAIIRETKEEIGIVPQLKRIIGVYRIDNDPRGIHLDIIYEGSFTGNITLSRESGSYNFFDPKNLPDEIAYKHREVINDWLSSLGLV